MRKTRYILVLIFLINCSKNTTDSAKVAPVNAEFHVRITDQQGVPYTCGYVRTSYEESTTSGESLPGNNELSSIRAIDSEGICRFIFPDNKNILVKKYQILDHLFQEINLTELNTLISTGKTVEENINLSQNENVDVYWQRLDFTQNYNLSGKRILAIVGNNYDYMECLMITRYLAHYGAEVVIASNRLNLTSHYWLRIEGKYQTVAGPDSVQVLLQDQNFNDFNCLFCPGGEGPENLIHEYRTVTNRIYQSWLSDTLFYSAICHGPLLLAESYIIDGKQITGHSEVQAAVVEAGGIYVPRIPVLVDGNIQTGNWPYFNSFATRLAEVLETW